MIGNDYDTLWDLEESERGNVPRDEKAFNKKYEEWMCRDWATWLKAHLKLPFAVRRMEDDDDAYFTDVAKTQPFRLGHTMEVVALADEQDPNEGLLVQVREGRRTAWVPLSDLEVCSKDDVNFWPVREYVVWSANR